MDVMKCATLEDASACGSVTRKNTPISLTHGIYVRLIGNRLKYPDEPSCPVQKMKKFFPYIICPASSWYFLHVCRIPAGMMTSDSFEYSSFLNFPNSPAPLNKGPGRMTRSSSKIMSRSSVGNFPSLSLPWGADLAFPTVFECLEPIVGFGPCEFRLPEARRLRRRRYEDDAMWIDSDIKKLRANSIEDGGFNISARCSISFKIFDIPSDASSDLP